MQDSPQYALVAYIRNTVGQFVENLRAELHPPHAHLPAHITILPPRRLAGTESEAISVLERLCPTVSAFDVSLGDVENFMPITPTVFIRVAFAAYRLRELHDALNTGALRYNEQWPYMPHLTIVKLDTMESAASALRIARERWANFHDPRKVKIQELTFVRQGEDCDHWIDIAPVRLGQHLAPTR
ncbi:MAG TPA: 2'-5' RNA ligase family protein [Terriglobales bacterium]|nr:2'-5' RNA ligase family protein [Terriglobales bacterium]